VKPILAILVLLLGLGAAAFAVEPGERLADPALEARARALSEQLRCVVCQNETIDESNAPLAHDLRVLLRQRIAAGDSDAQAVKFLTDRYGNFDLEPRPKRDLDEAALAAHTNAVERQVKALYSGTDKQAFRA